MSKHSKHVREWGDAVHCDTGQANGLYAAADHMKKLERELRIARKALRDIAKGESNHRGVRCEADEAQLALKRMRQARRKP